MAESLLDSNPSGTTTRPQENQNLIDLNPSDSNPTNQADDVLQKIIELSKKEEEDRAKRLQEEDEELMKIIELSMLEK